MRFSKDDLLQFFISSPLPDDTEPFRPIHFVEHFRLLKFCLARLKAQGSRLKAQGSRLNA
jgi:hypothetical protein